MVGPAGPLATISREPGQARKGAAAAVTLCAGVWLAGSTSSFQALAPFYINIFSAHLAVFAVRNKKPALWARAFGCLQVQAMR